MKITTRINRIVALLIVMVTIFNVIPYHFFYCAFANNDNTVSDNSLSDDSASDNSADIDNENDENNDKNDEENTNIFSATPKRGLKSPALLNSSPTYTVEFHGYNETGTGGYIEYEDLRTTVSSGELLPEPDPDLVDSRVYKNYEGTKYISGWKELSSEKIWDFENDVVTKNTTLIATWELRHKFVFNVTKHFIGGSSPKDTETETLYLSPYGYEQIFPNQSKEDLETYVKSEFDVSDSDGDYTLSYIDCPNVYEFSDTSSTRTNNFNVDVYYIQEGATVIMPVNFDGTDYPRADYPSVQYQLGNPCISSELFRYEWSDTPITGEDVVEVQMPGSAHKIYAKFEYDEDDFIDEDGCAWSATCHCLLYTDANKVYLFSDLTNIDYFDFSKFDVSYLFIGDSGCGEHSYNTDFSFDHLHIVDFSNSYGLDNFSFPTEYIDSSGWDSEYDAPLHELYLGNAKWPHISDLVSWPDTAGVTLWSDEKFENLKVLDLRNVNFDDVPTMDVDGKECIRLDYSILADTYVNGSNVDVNDYNSYVDYWYGEFDKSAMPKPTYIDDDADGIAEGEVTWSLAMSKDEMKHRFVTADMATLPPKAKTIKVHYLSGSSYSRASEKIVPVDCYVGETITMSNNVKTNDFNQSFDGWYTPDGTKLNLNSYKVEEDLTDIYAMYRPYIEFKNVKNTNGSSTDFTYLDYNTAINADKMPEAKEKNGYEVTGWEYTSDAWYPTLGDTSTGPLPFDPTMPITRNMTIKPVYTKIGSSTPDPNPGPGYDAVTITLHEMVKEGDVYVEKSSQDCQFPAEMANGESQDTTDIPLAYLLTGLSYYGYNQTVHSPFVGISNSDDGPSGTFTLTPDDHLYLFFEGEPEDDGSVAVLCSGPEFHKLLRQKLDDSGQYMVERVNTADDFDMDSATIVSTYYSPYPIYACADEDNEQLMRLYTEASTIELNEDSSYLFANVMVASMGRIDSSNVKNASFMFMRSYCKDIASSLDTSSVTNMTGMFMEYMSEDIDISSYDTSNVENMGLMFEGCELTKSINLSGINTSKVKNMAGMFYRDSALESLDLTSFDTSNVESMLGMFAGVEVDTLDLSSFNTSKVKNMDYMFYFSKFDTLDISGFTFDSITKDMPSFVYGFKTLKMGKVSPGRDIGFAEYMFYLDDNEDGQIDSPTAYGKAIDDNENHTYKLLIKVNYFDDDMLYAEQYYSNPKKDMVKPEDPSKEGMKFVGWIVENGDLFNFDDISASYSVSPVINLYAKWVPTVVHTDECKITYWTQAGTKPDTVWVKKNQKIKPFDEPVYVIADAGVTDDFHFLGWCKEDGTFWDFDNDIVTEDTTLYAVFDVVLVEINYLDNESFDSDYIAVPYGETISVDDIDPTGTHGNVRSVKYFGYYQNEHTAGSSYFSSFKTMAKLEQELGSKLQTYDFDAPVICPLVLYVDCDRIKWRHMFFKECPDVYKKDMNENKTFLEMISKDNLCCDVYLEDGESFVPPVFDNTNSWNKYAITDGDKVYQKGEAIVGSNKHEYYYMEDIKDLPVTVDFEALCTDSGTQRQGPDIYASTAKVKYGDKIKPPSGDRADVIGTVTYKWVAVPASKEEEVRNALKEALEDAALNENPSDINYAECMESVVSDGTCNYYEFDDQALMEKYTMSELLDEDNHRLKITLFQIPASVNYTITVPDKITASEHSFLIKFDCGAHFCNDVTLDFESNEVYLPNTKYTVKLYEDSSYTTPLTSLTFTEAGSKRVYIKSEADDGFARIGSDSVAVNFSISDLGSDEKITSGG